MVGQISRPIALIAVAGAAIFAHQHLGIGSVTELKRRSPQRMYDQLCRLKRQRLDPCCLDVFVAAVAQARDPELPIEQRQWWHWSKIRKARVANEVLKGSPIHLTI